MGTLKKQLSIAYARRNSSTNMLDAQKRDYITAIQNEFAHADEWNNYQTGIAYQSRAFEINHFERQPNGLIKLKDTQILFDQLIAEAKHFDEELPKTSPSIARLISSGKTIFWNDTLEEELPPGQFGVSLLIHHEEAACFNDKVIEKIFGGKVDGNMLSREEEGNYIQKDGYWWQGSAINHFKNAEGFFLLDHTESATGEITQFKYDAYHLNIIETIDPLDNIQKGEVDYNLVTLYRLIDENDNVSEILYDALGMPIANFQQGTVLDESQNLQLYGTGLMADYVRQENEYIDEIIAAPAAYLQGADSFLYYDLNAWEKDQKPLCSISISRENLVFDGKGNQNEDSRCQLQIEYQDGFGRAIQSKRKVEAGPAIKRLEDGRIAFDENGEVIQEDTTERWLVSGHVVYNNKQLPIRQFEPYFSSQADLETDELLESFGVSAQNYYDPLGRLNRRVFPNGTFTEFTFTPWEMRSYDEIDTVDRSLYKIFRESLPSDDPEKMALDRSLAHKETPAIIHLDPLGREIATMEINNNGPNRRVQQVYDNQGNLKQIIDARDLLAFEYKHDMQGRLLYEKSIDAGEKWSFYNQYDQLIHHWDGRGIHQRMYHDELDRLHSIRVDGALGLDQFTERFIYGEEDSISQAKERNLRGQLVRHFDQAGTMEVAAFTPTGLPLKAERKLLDQFSKEVNWNNPDTVDLENEPYISRYTYDALGRVVEKSLPDQTTRKFVFLQGGGVEKVIVVSADGHSEELLKQSIYDARGLREEMLLGNAVKLKYTYDSETFRMIRLQAQKIVEQEVTRTYQDIAYTYDPVGNLIYSLDRKQTTRCGFLAHFRRTSRVGTFRI